MSEEEQRIAIAESVGYRIEGITGGVIVYKPNESQGFGYCVEGRDHPEIVKMLPDYLNDLNAMHEAVAYAKTQYNDPESDGLLFCEATYIMTLNVLLGRNHWDCEFCIVEATAAQRAEAFLKTIDKWKA